MSKPKTSLPSFNWMACEPKPLIGVDEVGRGCLAGPVYACAVILSPTFDISELTDSKKLTAIKRKELTQKILQKNQYGIGIASIEEISKYNILNASLLAMRRAVLKLKASSGHILVDGNQKIPKLSQFQQTSIVKGDLRVPVISAASIVAKVFRDKEMSQQALNYPHYGFEKHKGYGTKAHKEALKKWGPTPLHRPTFSGVKELLLEGASQ